MKEWLKTAIFYEIYPQSFRDSNGDGIGDLQGIIEKLDYIQGLGFNALWLNPCFDSPFVDAGYDVRDYYRVAPRYGTNEDLKALFDAVHSRGMHILLDLVPGHTSVECSWFRESQKAERNAYTDRYVWNDSVWDGFSQDPSIMGFIRGGTERAACCAVNFFNAQPALNYGYYQPDPSQGWQQAMDDEGPMSTRRAIEDVMAFWLSLGCDGFRVDMAGSLVKNDPDQKGTIALWQEFRAFLNQNFPDAVLVSEWGQPDRSLLAGFDMDFLLHFGPSHYLDLFRTNPYFSRKGTGNLRDFFVLYCRNRELTGGKGLICLPTGNHDMVRIAKTLDPEELKIAYTFVFTMPGVPFLYYGDEIGMHYVEGLKSVEGGYERTGSRSPMAWDRSVNAGFSSAPTEDLYIAQDSTAREINVETEEKDPESLLNFVKKLIAFRREMPELNSDAGFELLELPDGRYPLVYRRGNSGIDAKKREKDGNCYPAGERKGNVLICMFNPSGEDTVVQTEVPADAEIVFAVGSLAGDLKDGLNFRRTADGQVILPAASAAVVRV